MGKYGRQRLLNSKKLQRGQALIEIIPAVLVFAMVISAALRYFEIFRGAVETEQVSRNLMVAKIGNSGTLTTPASQLANPVQTNPSDRATNAVTMSIEGSVEPVIQDNVFIDPSVSCFTTFPPDFKRIYSTAQIFVYGGAAARTPVEITTYSSICRRAP